jgi:hypothetical protein
MSRNPSLFHKALLAWRDELERQHEAALTDKRTKLRDGMRRKLEKMFGTEHLIELEDDDRNDLVLRAVIENLLFLAFRSPEGAINVVLLMPCPRCGHQMPSSPLTRLANNGVIRRFGAFTRAGFRLGGWIPRHYSPTPWPSA